MKKEWVKVAFWWRFIEFIWPYEDKEAGTECGCPKDPKIGSLRHSECVKIRKTLKSRDHNAFQLTYIVFLIRVMLIRVQGVLIQTIVQGN